MTKYLISLSIVFVFALLSLYGALYFGWLSATPLGAAQLQRAQYDCKAWFWSFVVSVILFGLLSWRLFWLRRQAQILTSTRRA